MEEKYLKLEAIALEKDEQIRQSWQALQAAAQSNSELEQGRNLAIAVVEETQQTAKAYETWAKGEVERALQSSVAAHDHAKRAEEEMSSAVNRERESYHAREVAEVRAEDAEQQVAAYNAKLRVFRTFCTHFNEAAKEFTTGPEHDFAKHFSSSFLEFWKQTLANTNCASTSTYSSIAANATAPSIRFATPNTALRPQHKTAATHRQGQPPVPAPPREDL
ncbi:hypothetical protein H634G_11012 [Metarhizium anisopliae BRIP 53293]|uniref:F-BAR domain-containing protein n=1 Tax=Metarhizium anisopliae BRIP 53293 TaxID=1291518 RepID=A0A0D9NI59_METAN|nr:hypothetical protein H634G_11012 [Metarhizium anisopliae BRIP 53293]